MLINLKTLLKIQKAYNDVERKKRPFKCCDVKLVIDKATF